MHCSALVISPNICLFPSVLFTVLPFFSSRSFPSLYLYSQWTLVQLVKCWKIDFWPVRGEAQPYDVCSEDCPIQFNGVYSQVNGYRLAGLDVLKFPCHLLTWSEGTYIPPPFPSSCHQVCLLWSLFDFIYLARYCVPDHHSAKNTTLLILHSRQK